MKYQNRISRTSEFGHLNKNSAVIILCLAVLSTLLYASGASNKILQGLILISVIVAAVKGPFLCLSVYIINSAYTGVVFVASVQVLIALIVIAAFLIHDFGMIRALKGGQLFLLSFFLVPLSYLVGIDSSISTAILMLVCVLCVVVIYNSQDYASTSDVAIIIWSYISRAIGISLYFIFQAVKKISVLQYGRLSFDGDIKSVAIIVAIPIILILGSKLEGKQLFNNIYVPLFDYFLLFLFCGILILTTARGVIAAVIIGLLVEVVVSKHKTKIIWRIFPVAVFIFFFVITSIDTETFRISRLFASDDYGSMSGRTTIWRYYFQSVVNNGPIHILLGLGPGEISRIGSTGYYAHSTFLDFFFSYGILGFVTVIIYEARAFWVLVKSRDALLIVLMIVSIIMYSTHGSAANISLFILQTVLLVSTKASNNTIEEV